MAALRTPLTLAAVLVLATSVALGQVTQCASDGSPQLRFVAKLSVSGCALFVHDTGANDGPHLAVEPVMCVTESLNKVLPRFDPVTKQTYVSVPVTLRDDVMLLGVQHQLRHLSPKSVKFATVTDIRVSTDSGSKFQALGFDWTPEKSVGFLRLGCKSGARNCSVCSLVSKLRASNFDRLLLSAKIKSSGSTLLWDYRLMLQNQSEGSFFDLNLHTKKYTCRPACRQLRFIRSIPLINCTARVHQRLDMKGHFLIEPLLCHNITSMSSEPVRHDYSRDMHYLKLDVVLQDDVTLDAVRTQLADLSPRSVAFMQLWRAQSVVASALSRRFEIGPLMVSGDWRSAQLRVYCRTEDQCRGIRSSVNGEPAYLWRHLQWSVTLNVSDLCLVECESLRHSWKMPESDESPTARCDEAMVSGCYFGSDCESTPATTANPTEGYRAGRVSKIVWTSDGRRPWRFIKIQQRLTGRMSFRRTWAEYERVFGDETDFWIGLSTIHSLSINGITLRVEIKLWNGTELHAEYAGFKVGDASTNYTMTYREMLRDRSSVSFDAMGHSKGMQFSTMDRDNDRSRGSCSNNYGNAGWWFNNCHHFNPNGLYPPRQMNNWNYVVWHNGNTWINPQEVRLMLQI